jgi:hypothetical protein
MYDMLYLNKFIIDALYNGDIIFCKSNKVIAGFTTF